MSLSSRRPSLVRSSESSRQGVELAQLAVGSRGRGPCERGHRRRASDLPVRPLATARRLSIGRTWHRGPFGNVARLFPGVFLAMMLGGCDGVGSGDPSSPEESDLPILRVGTSGDYPPFSRDGEGFDIDVAELFAADVGYQLEWVPFRWPELADDVAGERFDLAMGGVTWRATRAAKGRMSRAVAAGGPCVVGASSPRSVAVNRGGILERWAREHFAGAEIRTTDDNLSLPDLLSRGEVEAFVTDSFEVAHFNSRAWSQECRPAEDRKVYWISEGRAADLAPVLDQWLDENESKLQSLRERHFGQPGARSDLDHLVDLLARRLAVMPWVAAAKAARGLPIEDLEREQRVLNSARGVAERHGLEAEGVRALFRAQIELAKRIQARTPPMEPELDLETEIRPLLIDLGDRIVAALAEVAPVDTAQLSRETVVPLLSWIRPDELDLLLEALGKVEPAR